jgi:PAS domain-containing protein
LVTQLKETITNGCAFQAFEIDCDWPEVGPRTVSLHASQFALAGHSARMALLSFHDITARKEAEAANARLAAIVESSDDAIVGKTIEGTIHSWNFGA